MEWLHGWLGLILGFSGLIFIHELGHFLLAKWNGVKVHVFSLGMGPYLFSFTWRGTVYVLSAIPIGGYVQMAGQNDLDAEEKPSKESTDYRNKSVGQRAQIIAAGAIFNIIFTIFAFTMCWWVGMEIDPPRIGMISPDKPLAKATLPLVPGNPAADLREGDRIIEVNGVHVKTFLEAMLQISGSPRNKEINMRVERYRPHLPNGRDVVYVSVAVEHDKKLGAQSIGLIPWRMKMNLPLGFKTQDRVIVGDGWVKSMEANPEAQERSPAWKAGIFKEGDELVRAGDVEIRSVDDMLLAGPRSGGKPTKFVVRRDGKLIEDLEPITPRFDEKEQKYLFGIPTKVTREVVELDPDSEAAKKGLKKGQFVWGFDPKEDNWTSADTLVWSEGTLVVSNNWNSDATDQIKIDLKVPASNEKGLVFVQERAGGEFFKTENFGEALSVAWGDTLRFSGSVFTVLRGLFTGDVGVSALSGGLGIGHAVFTVASHAPFMKFLWFLGFISLNLGVLQFVPIPLLDGFHLVLLAIERLKGSPVAPKVQVTFQWVGIIIVGSLILFATYNDITRIFLK